MHQSKTCTKLIKTDAGFAPIKSIGRRSGSGTCFIFQQCLLKRHQLSVTLSPCESELVALQSGVYFVLGRLYPWLDILPQDGQVTGYEESCGLDL